MDYVTDTHPLVWYFTEDHRLSPNALSAFEETTREGTLIIPIIVLAEIMYISKRGKTPLTFEETIAKVEAYANFDVCPLDMDILRTADRISADLEMHDRIIVATALHFDTALITKDQRISELRICRTIW